MKCPKCGATCQIDIMPFEYSFYWCPKCKQVVKKMGIC